MTGLADDARRGVAVVVVLYMADAAAAMQRVEPIATAGYLHIMVDNTPGATSHAAMPGIVHIALGSNKGIACALNTGVDAARNAGKRLVVTFDQDSEYNVELLDSMVARYLSLKPTDAGQPLALGPLPLNKITRASYLRRRDRLRMQLRPKRHSTLLRVNELITSGLLADVATYDASGPYREDFFIDFVDHEWCWRVGAAGGQCLVDLQVVLPHLVGKGDIPYTLGMKHGAAFRLYFLFRNGVFLLSTAYMPVFDKVKFLLLLPIKLVAFAFFQDRSARFSYAFAGLGDGLRKVMRRPESGIS